MSNFISYYSFLNENVQQNNKNHLRKIVDSYFTIMNIQYRKHFTTNAYKKFK